MRKQDQLPSRWKMIIANIIYETQIMSNQLNIKQKLYIETAKTDFKHGFKDQTESFNLENLNCLKNAGHKRVTISHQKSPGEQ